MKASNLLRKLGPGLLFAGAAIGVSHLVMSTTAGARYGMGLLWAVILANLIKYPFFEYAPRYTGATGDNLIQGYKKLGNWALWIYIVITVGTMFTVQAAVTIVTAGVLSNMMPAGINLSQVSWSMIILLVCMLILIVGKYKMLDSLIKYIIILLAICTITALVLALNNPPEQKAATLSHFSWDVVGIGFLIALMGWMPAPLDLSVWNSIWAQEKRKQLGSFNLKDSLFDFNIGYIGAALLALCFLGLGATVIYGQDIQIPQKGGAFAKLLINTYTACFDQIGMGAFAYYIITIAAFTTMFSTTLTCLDAYPRVLSRVLVILLGRKHADPGEHVDDPGVVEENDSVLGMPSRYFALANYWGWILLVSGGAIVLLTALGGKMGLMVKIATILSFLPTPLFAFINYKLVTSDHMPIEARPGKAMRIFSWLCMIGILGFVLAYLYTLIFA